MDPEYLTSFEIKISKFKPILKILNTLNTQCCFIFEPSQVLVYCADECLINMLHMELTLSEFVYYNTKGQTVYIDIKKLSDIVKLVDEPNVTIKFDERVCTMFFGNIVRKFNLVENKNFDHSKLISVVNLKTENSIDMKPAKIKAILSGMERYDKVLFKMSKDNFTVGEDDTDDFLIKTVCDTNEFLDYFVSDNKIWMSYYNPQLLLKFVKSLPSKTIIKVSIGTMLPMIINVVGGLSIKYLLAPIIDK